MAGGIIKKDFGNFSVGGKRHRAANAEPVWMEYLLTAVMMIFVLIFLILPIVMVFKSAFANGIQYYFQSLQNPDTAAAIRLTLLASTIAVFFNTIFGVMAAWAITRFDFKGKQFLITLIDLPLSVSPVIGGLIYVLLFGAQGVLGPYLREWNIQIIFAVPGIVLATMFVTFPFVARGLIPLMEAQGKDEEEAALTLGARGWQVFFRITLPKIKWGLLYGVILCNARAMGEFGAVSVVSGHIRGRTNTLPLQIEVLYNEYHFVDAFAVASILSFLALITLFIKTYGEWRVEKQFQQAQE